MDHPKSTLGQELPSIKKQMVSRVVAFAGRVEGETSAVTSMLMHLNRLAGLQGAAQRGEEVDAGSVIESLLSQLAALLRRQPAEALFITQMIDDLNQLALDGGLYVATATPKQPAGGLLRRAGFGVTYYIRQGRHGLELTETREGNKKDFHVSEADFNRALDVMANAGQNLTSFVQLHKSFVDRGGIEVKSAYPLRVVLRFLRSVNPPAVRGARSGYAIVEGLSADGFRSCAQQAWDALPPKG